MDRALPGFDFSHVQSGEIEKIIQAINPKKAQGYDCIPPKILKLGAPVISHDMCHLINESIDSSDFPDSLKLAEVSSQFKKGDSLNKVNYRPVSLLVAMSKIYGRVMAKQLSSYFMSIFSTLLYAFRQKYSCQSILLNMIQSFRNAG